MAGESGKPYYLHITFNIKVTDSKRILFFLACVGFFLLTSGPDALSQACSGNILYKEDFGGTASSPDIGTPLPSNVTSYSFTSQVVQDGFYSIRKTVPNSFPSWISGTDHTGNGYMMVVNASYTRGLFYETRIDHLCEGSSFYFSAWVGNLTYATASEPLNPNLEFVIRRASDSTVIDSIETGTLPRYQVLTWKQYGLHFDLPEGESSVILQIFNHQKGGLGNDLVLDDISFSLCGPVIGLNESGTYQHSFDACVGDQVVLSADVEAGFYRNPGYQWQFSRDGRGWEDIPGATTLTLKINATQSSDSGEYRILTAEAANIQSAHCRASSDPIPLNVYMPRKIALASNSPVCEGASLFIRAPEGLQYAWTGPDGFTSAGQQLDFSPARPSDGGIYQLTLITSGGCVSQARETVSVQADDLSVSLGTDSLLCEGASIRMDATNPGASYLWNTGQRTPFIQVDTGGFFRVTVTKGVCQKSDSLAIRQIRMPVADLGPDTTICEGEPFTLDAAFRDASAYLWQDGSTGPDYPIVDAGRYSVAVSNQCGMATSAVYIKTEECADRLIYPTGFSPNGDGQNDLFRPRRVISVSHYNLKILDRWGYVVFETADPGKGWNGTRQGSRLPMATYVWIAQYTRVRDNKPLVQHGTITLLR